MNFPFWNPFSWQVQYLWLLMLPLVGVFVLLIYFLDWISPKRRWGTWILNRLGA